MVPTLLVFFPENADAIHTRNWGATTFVQLGTRWRVGRVVHSHRRALACILNSLFVPTCFQDVAALTQTPHALARRTGENGNRKIRFQTSHALRITTSLCHNLNSEFDRELELNLT